MSVKWLYLGNKKRSTQALVANFASQHGLEATLEVFYSKFFINFVFTPFNIKKLTVAALQQVLGTAFLC